MPIPEEARRMMEAILEQSKREERNADRFLAYVRDMVVALGVRPTPCGMSTVGRILHGFSEHCAEHRDTNDKIPIELVLRIFDEFVAMWATQRIEEDPDYLTKVGTSVTPDVKGMFQSDVPEVKVV